MLKRTPLYEDHVRLGANIVPFAGWEMPVYYSSVIDEHTATREKAGLFDTSHMGEFVITGPDSADFIDSLITNDLKKLEPGKAIYTVLPNDRGGCIDDLWVYMIAADNYFLCVNASTSDKDFAWIQSHAGGRNVKLVNLSDEYGMIALQGKIMPDVMAKLAADAPPPRFSFSEMKVAGIKCMVSRTGYTGEDGVELYVATSETSKMWNALLEAGGPLGLKPAGLGARDTLRLEACYSLYGHELNEDTTPIEAAISFSVAKEKDNYPGSAVIRKQIAEGVSRKVMAFELVERGVPREHYAAFVKGEKVGEVTSGCFSPSLKKGIGLVMLQSAYAKVGQDIDIEIRGKLYAGRVVKRPFIQFGGGK